MKEDWPASLDDTDDALLHAALRLAPDERERFLEQLCATDEARKRELVSLIKAHENAGAFLESPALGQIPADLKDPSKDDMVGQEVGPWRVHERIGTGGMGAVYRAERADSSFEREVALKVIKRGMDSEEILRRFRQERQVLADLDHPNIARLIDGGSVADGRPFLVMDLVDGEPITDFCRRRNLSVCDRLKLFLQCCDAVSHAHQHLLVHRDLKPGNILVNSEGQVKLLDFGIAKVLTGSHGFSAADATVTRRQRRFSPAYASPEQVKGARITTGSDVYSLGVVLYELVTGKRPHLPETASREELERAICQDMPPRPSVAARARSRKAPDRARGAAPLDSDLWSYARLNVSAADLDTIVMKALEKEPERRYASVAAMADDIRRLLEGEPINARSPGLGEQFRRFVRRNRALTGMITVVAAALVLTVAGTSIGMVRANEATREARAQQAAAEQTGAFLREMLASVSPHHARGRDTTLLREILDSAERRLDDKTIAGSMPAEAVVSLHTVIASTYRGLGEYDEAQRRFEIAFEASNQLLLGDHPVALGALLGIVNTLTDTGRFRDAAPYAEEALAMSLRIRGRDHEDTVDAYNAIARINRFRGQYSDAEAGFIEALDISRRELGPASSRTLIIMNNLGDLLAQQGRYTESRALFEEVLAIRQEILPEDHPDLLLSMNNLAKVRSSLGDAAGAAEVQRRVIEIRRRVLGEDHDHVATTLMNLAVTLQMMGDMPGAIEATREAVEIYKRKLPPDHPWTAKGLSNLGVMLAMQGDVDEAEAMHQEALDIRLRAFDGDHAEVAMSLASLGALYEVRGDFSAAEKFHREALDMRLRVFGEQHPHVAWSMAAMGRMSAIRGDKAAAERLLRDAFEMRRDQLGDHHALVARAGYELAEALMDDGRLDEAIELLVHALEKQRELLPHGHRSTVATLRELGLALTRAGRPAEGIDYLIEAVELAEGPPPLPDGTRARTHAALGECLAALGDEVAARPLLEQSLLLFDRTITDRRLVLDTMGRLCAVYDALGRFDDSERLRREISELKGAH